MRDQKSASNFTFGRTFSFALLLLTVSGAFAPAFAEDPFIAFRIDVDENRIDGCTNCGCQLKGELTPGQAQKWWIAFGLVRLNRDQVWQADRSPSYCGAGEFKETESEFRRTVGVPYVTMQLSTRTQIGDAEEVRLNVETVRREFSALRESGETRFAETTGKRTFILGDGTRASFPLLLGRDATAEDFQVHEVIVNLWATVLGNEPPARYGSLAISADVPGALVLLDGGEVGRIQEGSPLQIHNVLAGKRNITVRDFSERESAKSVTVKEGRLSEVSLEVLHLQDSAANSPLSFLGENPQGHREFWRSKDSAMVVEIPAGTFLMGSPEGQGEPDERPQHEVSVETILIDKTEVTWRQFKKYAQETGARLPPPPVWGIKDNYPISFVLWEEAKQYCAWVGGRLPSEAEWEKAARGTDGRKYPWGDAWDPTRCNSIAGGMHRPESAGSFPACVTQFGVLDMAGSVWEWTSDEFRDYSLSPMGDPEEGDSGVSKLRVMRGGAWMNQPSWLRTAYRHERSPRSRNMDHGFRCVMDPEDIEE